MGIWLLVIANKNNSCYTDRVKEVSIPRYFIIYETAFVWDGGESFYHQSWEVEPESVGQYIGEIDKNNKEIFKGDIIKFPSYLNSRIAEDAYNYFYDTPEYMVTKIVFRDGCFFFKWKRDYDDREVEYCDVEVIGNIYENPELLESEK